MGKLKKVGIGIGVIAVIYMIAVFFGAGPDGTGPLSSEHGEIEKNYGKMSDAELSAMAVDWNYRDILRNIDDYSGKIIFVDGNVVNVNHNADSITFCVQMDSYSCDDRIFVGNNGHNTWLEDDQLSGFVKVKHLKETFRLSTTTGELIGTGNYIPKVNEIRLICSNC